MHFFGFHVRFKDLARGGIRTISLQNLDQLKAEQNHVFTECYNLAYTQHKKNKEIPEGGAKGVIFLQPFFRLDAETEVLQRELDLTELSEKEKEEKIATLEKANKSFSIQPNALTSKIYSPLLTMTMRTIKSQTCCRLLGKARIPLCRAR